MYSCLKIFRLEDLVRGFSVNVGRFILIGMGLLIGLEEYSRASVVVSQLPSNQGGGGAADTEFLFFNQPYWERSADEFVLDSPATIRQCIFWSFYGGNLDQVIEPLPSTQTIRLRLYDARPIDNLPGKVLFEESFNDPPRVATGLFMHVGAGPPEYRYEIDLSTPWSLASGTQYWLEIAQIGAIDSLFRWEYSFGNGAPFAFTNPLTDWRRYSGNANLAFQLSTTPEPVSSVLLMVGLVAFVRAAKR